MGIGGFQTRMDYMVSSSQFGCSKFDQKLEMKRDQEVAVGYKKR